MSNVMSVQGAYPEVMSQYHVILVGTPPISMFFTIEIGEIPKVVASVLGMQPEMVSRHCSKLVPPTLPFFLPLLHKVVAGARALGQEDVCHGCLQVTWQPEVKISRCGQEVWKLHLAHIF